MDICWSRDLNYNNENLKFNCQLKIGKVKDVSALFLFYSPFYNQTFVCGGILCGGIVPPGYNRDEMNEA